MEVNPKLKVPLALSDKIFEVIGWVLLISFWALSISNYNSLPDSIPIHFDATGVADGFGKKAMILTLPAIATLLFILLSVLNMYPHHFNYPRKVTLENALLQYTSATRLLRYLKVMIMAIFGMISFKTIQHAKGEAAGLGAWFLPLTLGLIFIPIIFYFIKSPSTSK